MPQIEARPRYLLLSLFAVVAVALLIVIGVLDLRLHRTLFYPRSTVLWHIFYVTLFVFTAAAALRLILNLRFRDVALQIDEHGVYVEGVTHHPILWAEISAVESAGSRRGDGRSFVVFRTTNEDVLIHFALFRPSFGRLGWRNWREVMINCGLLDVSAADVRQAIENGMMRAKAGTP